MCDPITFAISAGVAAYGYRQQKSAAEDQRNAMKKVAARQRRQAMGEEARADAEARTERRETYKTRRAGLRASESQTSGTAQAFGPRSFFSPA